MNSEREQVRALVLAALDPKLPDEALGELLDRLGRMVPHPDIGALIFHHAPELPPDQIVDIALAYVPVALGHKEDT
jgi:hypothetical protein